VSGGCASTLPAAAGHGAKSTGPWTRPRETFVRSSSPRAVKATARCGPISWRRSRRSSRSAPSRPTGPTTLACVTPPWRGAAAPPSSRSARTVGAGQEDGPAARARTETLRASQPFGRAFWTRLTGYHARSRIEAQMRRLKPFGERIASRDPNRQAAEIHTRIALINRVSALGRAEIVRADSTEKERETLGLRASCAIRPDRGPDRLQRGRALESRTLWAGPHRDDRAFERGFHARGSSRDALGDECCSHGCARGSLCNGRSWVLVSMNGMLAPYYATAAIPQPPCLWGGTACGKRRA
jgi:hypothetical protein